MTKDTYNKTGGVAESVATNGIRVVYVSIDLVSEDQAKRIAASLVSTRVELWDQDGVRQVLVGILGRVRHQGRCLRRRRTYVRAYIRQSAAGRLRRKRLVLVASLRGESSNQLFETLEEWNNYLERYNGVAILSARRCRVSKGFPGSFGFSSTNQGIGLIENNDHSRCIG
jgi:hypothetical protein